MSVKLDAALACMPNPGCAVPFEGGLDMVPSRGVS